MRFLTLKQDEFKQSVKYDETNILVQMLLLFTFAGFFRGALFAGEH